MKRIAQEHSKGCGIAAIAMVTGKSYAEVLAACDADPRIRVMQSHGCSEGVAQPTMEYLLQREGFWLRTLYPVRVDEWPPRPFAEAHIAQVKMPKGGTHYVAMDENGVVLDPLHEGLYALGDYEAQYVIGAMW